MRKNRKFRPSVDDALEYRVAPSAVVSTSVIISNVNVMASPDSGDDPPVTQPDLPPSGPGGPGTSS